MLEFEKIKEGNKKESLQLKNALAKIGQSKKKKKKELLTQAIMNWIINALESN